MALYAMSDLHLSLSIKDKPMDIFSEAWENYMEKIKTNWQKNIKNDDLVVISGDVSWATYLDDAVADFDYINKLNGSKIISKGNHDYWWSTKNKIDKFLEDNHFDTIKILHNNCYVYEDWVICGTRGWVQDDEKIFNRELNRLELSSKEAEKYPEKKILVSIHYPPFNNEVMDLLKKYNVNTCVYGHLHGDAHQFARNGIFEGINIQCVACDYINFMPMKLAD